MQPSLIKNIDHYVGIPLCFLLSLWRKWVSLFSKQVDKIPTPNDKILFIKFIEQGATVLAYDSLMTAIEKVSKENVYFCVFRSNVAILYLLDIIPTKNILVIEDKKFFSFVISVLKTLWYLRKNKISICIDMEFFSRFSAIFSYLSGAKIRVGLHRFNAEQPYRGDLMTHKVNHNSHLHISQYYRMLVDVAFNSNTNQVPINKLPIVPKEEIKLPKYNPPSENIEKIYDKLKQKFKLDDIKERRIVLLNPNASDMLPIRKWETENFIKLSKKILEKWRDVLIVFTGAPSEKDAVEKIVKQINHRNVVSMAGETNFRELIELYHISDLLITNDSGPGHFTTLTNTNTIVLFGPETPLLFGSLSPSTYVIFKNLGCSPCVNVYNHRFSPCNNNLCMKMIEVDEVFSLCEKVLNFKTLKYES